VLITDTAFTAPVGPGPAREIAVRAFMAGTFFLLRADPGSRALPIQAAAASPLRQ
jgi:hypothetical protein